MLSLLVTLREYPIASVPIVTLPAESLSILIFLTLLKTLLPTTEVALPPGIISVWYNPSRS